MTFRSLSLLFIFFATSLHAQVFFRDDFSGGKSHLWNQRNDGPRPGNFQTQSNGYRITSTDPAQSLPRAIVREGSPNNYFIQADVKVNVAAGRFGTASLLSYYIDSNHYYEFSVDPSSRFWSLQKIDKSGLSLLGRGNILSISNTYRLGLYIRDGDLRAFIDNVMVAHKSDSRPLPGGAFGLSARGADTFWDNVLVKTSDPQEFFYAAAAKTTNAQGIASFGDAVLNVVLESGQKLSGVQVVRIRRDALSYFIFLDPSNRGRLRSGFVREFESLGGKEYHVKLRKAGSGFTSGGHGYNSVETSWILDFLRRSARIDPKGVSADINITRDLYLRSQGLMQSGNTLINDSTLGTSGTKAEGTMIVFGKWEEFGNYREFKSQSGTLSTGRAAIGAVESMLAVPGNSKFTLYVLRVSAGGTSGILFWLVQEDSRAFLVTESVGFPNEIRPGNSYNVPFTIRNTGEAAGNFRFSIVLSQNGFMGPTDIKLAQRNFSGMGPGSRVSEEIEAKIPSNVPSGRYFIGSVMETEARRDRLIRIDNLAGPVKPVTVGDFPANGQIEISLNWEGSADLDLHVTDPYGETLYYFRSTNQSGGRYEEDRECFNNNGQFERVVYDSGNAAAGLYQISVHYFRSCGEARDAHWTLHVNVDGRSSDYSGTIKPGEYIRAADFTR
ncbi:MAG TPA: hypothetical protein VLH08_09935 [Acidobacteriota bacterium]|nr:hypothetical protein [Acidobacteriota bacterium]